MATKKKPSNKAQAPKTENKTAEKANGLHNLKWLKLFSMVRKYKHTN
jgi:hypothetical protein